jgi:hypothetical protein
MNKELGGWYIGIICRGRNRFQAVLEDPTHGDPTCRVSGPRRPPKLPHLWPPQTPPPIGID